ncbi:uncharacterized protein LAESUDRAFT_757959 [Laetiporus sulphureus 93-53]|uniref:Uncharacterized protein n=1 Tax=Laetiporus sulphureus 93-53 TaxID=1314785 RepID=A0A165F375_9APHY|nr:uncharacterized protein LAESUDRAFT_757959 [Laetiporus sulphureus 93-53]KZT08282.1 hypothetical protein LAESUDRAFT_757959 [Laetiporus sulphureus 93-53]
MRILQFLNQLIGSHPLNLRQLLLHHLSPQLTFRSGHCLSIQWSVTSHGCQSVEGLPLIIVLILQLILHQLCMLENAPQNELCATFAGGAGHPAPGSGLLSSLVVTLSGCDGSAFTFVNSFEIAANGWMALDGVMVTADLEVDGG